VGVEGGAAGVRGRVEGAGGEAGVGWGVVVGGSRILPGGVVMRMALLMRFGFRVTPERGMLVRPLEQAG